MITSYNLEEFIGRAVESVVNQEMPCRWELLIGDDGSTDNTIGIVNSWIEKYPDNIKLYQWSREETHTMNGSRSAANRARLLEKAIGDYLIYLDGDDCWLGTKKLKLQFELLESTEYSSCSCCGHNILKYVIDNKTGSNMVDSCYQQRIFTKREYYRHGMYIHTNTLLFRSSCKTIMLDLLNREFLNDLFITFLMLQCGSMLYLPETYAQYNITGSGLWTGNNKVFGSFRNIQLYDLERYIDPQLEPFIFRGFCTNMEVILREYSKNDIIMIRPLVEGLDPNIFEYTHRFFEILDPTTDEAQFKKRVRCRIFWAKVNYRLFILKQNLHLA